MCSCRIIGLQLVSEFDFVSDTEGQCSSFSHAAVGSAPMCIIKTVSGAHSNLLADLDKSNDVMLKYL